MPEICNNYDGCRVQKKEQLIHTMDKQSLYRDRIMDNQTVNRRCYESNPVEIIEGFTINGWTLRELLKWVFVGLVIWTIVTMVSKPLSLYSATSPYNTLANVTNAAFSATSTDNVVNTVQDLAGGVTESLSDLSFLRTDN
jgi:hypothetical protein